ncbi:Zinc phosphodiesterase ELAC protein 2 [Dictyocoela muelleri]|nr:Zinc phosphodiesterase ELAC protein 2 [Dictyocoela muelleri]
MSYKIQIITTKSGKAILLSYLNKKYLFGCFEGFQRYSIESKLKMNSYDAIFITSIMDIPAIIGIYLTCADNNKESMRLVGNKFFKSVFDSAMIFANRPSMKIIFSEYFDDGVIKVRRVRNLKLDWQDEIINEKSSNNNSKKIKKSMDNEDINIKDINKKDINNNDINNNDINNNNINNNDINNNDINNKNKNIDKDDDINNKNKNIEKDDERCSFILKLPTIRGKFEINKLDKNFPRNWIKRLTNKEKIEFEGKIYDGANYLGADEIPPVICIVNSEINFDDVKDVDLFFCFDYKMYLRLKNKCLNVFYIEDEWRVEYRDLYDWQKRCNEICKNFLLPVCQRYEEKTSLEKIMESNNDEESEEDKKNNEDNEIEEIKGDEIIIYKNNPNTPLNDGDYFLFKNHQFNLTRKIFFTNKDLKRDAGYNLKKNTEKNDNDVKNLLNPPYVLFLGTGCALPSKYRNVSAIIVVFKEYSILLDCGEDTYSQVLRVYGNTEILSTLKYIFISHSHADHHLGLAKIAMSCEKPLTIFGPDKILNFLKKFPNANKNIFIEPEKIINKNNDNESTNDRINNEKYFINEEVKLSFCRVNHCSDSYGIRIDGDKSISYSGDCRPTKKFVELSKNVDLMIHEATFEDEHLLQAKKTFHSTISEAKEIFKLSGASKIILTHLSQRYKSFLLIENDVLMAVDFFLYDFRSLDNDVLYRLNNKIFE